MMAQCSAHTQLSRVYRVTCDRVPDPLKTNINYIKRGPVGGGGGGGGGTRLQSNTSSHRKLWSFGSPHMTHMGPYEFCTIFSK